MKRMTDIRFVALMALILTIIGAILTGRPAAADQAQVAPPVFGAISLFPGSRLELTVVDAADLAGINLPPAPCYVNLAFRDGAGRTMASEGPITLMPGAPVSAALYYEEAVEIALALGGKRPMARPEVRPVVQPLTWSDFACDYLVAWIRVVDEADSMAVFSHEARAYGRGQSQQEAPAFAVLAMAAGEVVRLSAAHAGDVLGGAAAAETCDVTLSFLGADGRAIGTPLSHKLASGAAGINELAIGPDVPTPFFARPVVTFTGGAGCEDVVAAAERYPGPNGPTALLTHPARLVWSNGQVPGE
jgi:hypothetical protein